MGGGAFQGASGDEGRNGEDGRGGGSEGGAEAGDSEDGSDGDDGVRGAEEDGAGAAEGLKNARSGRGPAGASEMNATDAVAVAAPDKPGLEVEEAGGGADHGANGVVGHGDDGRFDAEGTGNFAGHLGQGCALLEAAGAVEVGGEVAVAELEPGVGAETAEGFEAVEGVAGDSPTAGGVG